jgi:hypothetical protein
MDALGIKVGDYIRVKVEDGAIVIQPLEAASQEQGQDARLKGWARRLRRDHLGDAPYIDTCETCLVIREIVDSAEKPAESNAK